MAAVDDERTGPAHHPAVDAGIDFIRSHAGRGKPFCCFISTAEPHDPYVPPKRFFDMYNLSALQLSPTLHDEHQGKPEVTKRMAAVWKHLTEEQWRMITGCYFATITFLDYELGRVIDALKSSGIYDETILLFTADHGDMLGGHGLFAKGITPYEEVYNVPLVLRGPGITASGSNSTHIVSHVDIAPTILELCSAPALPNCQGRSYRAILAGKAEATDWQDAYAEFYGQRFVYTQRIVWHENWKYVFSPGGTDELYDLADDPHETKNLACDPAYHDRLIDMARRMWRKVEAIDDWSLYNTHYKTLRTAPIGPLEA